MKQFRYLKPGDKLFVIDSGKPYVSEVVSVEFKLAEFHPDTDKNDGSGFIKYVPVDKLPDDIEYDDAKVTVTLKNHHYSDVDKKIDALFDESHPEKETWAFEDDALSSYYSYMEWIYVFSDIESLQRFRDREYEVVVKPWDDILNEYKSLC